MKKMLITLLAVTLAFVLVFPNSSPAQGLAAKGFIAGLNLANVSGDDVEMEGISPSNSMGFTAGAFLVYNFSENLGIRPEVHYSQKGAKWEEGDVKMTAKFAYVDVPILVQFAIPTEGGFKPILLAGPYVAFNMSAKVVYDIEGFDMPDEDIKDDIKSMDYGIMFGAGVVISDMLEITARYGMGLTSVDDSEEEMDIKNKIIQFTAGISF